jgi:uncharacterized membrane protein
VFKRLTGHIQKISAYQNHHTPYPNQTQTFFILTILLVALFLRVYHLDTQSLRGDEAATVHYSAMPVSELWELSRITDPHPPGYYLLLHPWQWLLGKNAWLMRFTGVIASLLCIAVLYTLARITIRNTPVALLAAALLAINPFQIWLAQDVRSYPVFTLLGLLSSWALWVALTRKVSRRIPWLLYILLTVACLYVHYYTVFLILFQTFFAIFNAKKFWSKKWSWLTAQVVIGILIIPGLYLASNLAGQAAGGIDTLPTFEILHRASTALLTGFTINATAGMGVSLLLMPVGIIGLITLLRHNFTTGTFWGLFFAVPVISVIILSLNRPFFKERFFIQALPAFEVLLAVGFLTLWKLPGIISNAPRTSYALRFISLLLLATLLLFNLHALNNYFTNPIYAKAPPWRLYHNYVNENAQPGDLMLTNFPEASVSYYTPDGIPFRVIPNKRDQPVNDLVADISETSGQYSRIWFLPLLRQGFDEQGDILNWLDRHGDRVHQVFFPAYNINLYLTPPTIEAQLIAQPVAFAHGIRLRGYQVFDKHGNSRLNSDKILTLSPGDEFTLSLYWYAGGPTENPYTVFTHLIAADGFNQAGQDNQPVWGSYPTTVWQPDERITDKYTLTLPQGIPPGDYRVRTGWYQSDTQARVAISGSQGQDYIMLDFIVRVKEN